MSVRESRNGCDRAARLEQCFAVEFLLTSLADGVEPTSEFVHFQATVIWLVAICNKKCIKNH